MPFFLGCCIISHIPPYKSCVGNKQSHQQFQIFRCSSSFLISEAACASFSVVARALHACIIWVNSIFYKSTGIGYYNSFVCLCLDLNHWPLGLQITKQRLYHWAYSPMNPCTKNCLPFEIILGSKWSKYFRNVLDLILLLDLNQCILIF